MTCRDRAWFDSQQELLAFARALGAGGWFAGEGFDIILGFFAAPWRWDREFLAWCAAGRPKAFEMPKTEAAQ